MYLFGGHTGQPHQYHSGSQNGVFLRWNALDEKTLEIPPGGQPLQSVALVSHDSHIYRIGGMRARNAEEGGGSRVDRGLRAVRPGPLRVGIPRAAAGSALLARRGHPRIPTMGRRRLEARRRLGRRDVGRRRPRRGPFPTKAGVARGDPAPAEAPRPGARRLRGAPLRHRRDGRGGDLSKRVDVYDPKSNVWTPGPDLPFVGFGVAAVVAQDKLYVSGRDGELHRARRRSVATRRRVPVPPLFPPNRGNGRRLARLGRRHGAWRRRPRDRAVGARQRVRPRGNELHDPLPRES